MIDKLKFVDPSKKCLNFLHERVLSNNYRGIQISQHNRYNFKQVERMLQIIYDLVGNEKMYIRTTDLSKRPYNTPNEFLYAEYTNIVNKEFGKSTQDSIRKNLFVDFHRMGLIYRFDKQGNKNKPYEKKVNASVSLTPLAIELIDKNKNILEKYMIFSRALDNLLRGLATDFLDIIGELDYLTEIEYTFFVSFIWQELNDRIITKEMVIDFVKEYRTLSKFQQLEVEEIVKNYCDPKKFSGNKVNKRDYHNWSNETKQVFMLLDMTVYYSYNEKQSRLEFMINDNLLFKNKKDINKLKRSRIEKNNYFKKHNVDKELGFELHHIIPLLWARNSIEFFHLDRWENMLYIDAKKHAIITQSGNKHIKLSFSDNYNVKLIDPTQNIIELVYNKNVIYNKDMKDILLENNNEILKSFI